METVALSFIMPAIAAAIVHQVIAYPTFPSARIWYRELEMTMFESTMIPGLLAILCLIGWIAYAAKYRPHLLDGWYRVPVMAATLAGLAYFATVMLYVTP